MNQSTAKRERISSIPGLIKGFVTLILVLPASTIAWGQSTSPEKPLSEHIIACQFWYSQAVQFNVVGKGNNEIIGLKHTNIFVYDGGRLQQLESFWAAEDSEAKKTGYRYEIRYSPDNQKEDGKYHKIEIIVKTSNGQQLKARLSLNGYYATKGYFKF